MKRTALLSFAAGLLVGTAATAASGTKGQIVRNAPAKTAPSGKAKAIPLIHSGTGADSAYMGLLEMKAGAKVPLHRDPTEEAHSGSNGCGAARRDRGRAGERQGSAPGGDRATKPGAPPHGPA